MGKRKKPKQARNSRTQKQFLSREQIRLSKETDYIIQRAQEGESRIVKLGGLILFSARSGDAWLLDIEDNLALCLAILGERQPFHIIENATNFSIEWAAKYQIDGEKFVVTVQSGQVRTIIGYPTYEILQSSK